jgi:hypothetical protein
VSAARVRAIWFALGIALIIAIWIVSLIPAPPALMGIQNEDKLHHALAYGGLMWWWGQLVPRVGTRVALAIAFASMGVAVEVAQGATGWRSFDTRDMVANTVGVAIGFALLFTPLGAMLTRLTAHKKTKV